MHLLRIAIIWLAVFTGCQLFALDKQVILQAILIKEDSCGKTGKRGELGCFQMMPANVKKYGGCQYIHAYAMLEDIISDMQARGVWVSSYNIALVWNGGPKAMEGKAASMSYRYALEVQQIYNRLTQPSTQPARPARF